MMRKFGLEKSEAHQDQNTLLEPNNFSPSWENGGEESAEVSNTLLKLRLEYDDIRAKSIYMKEQSRIMKAEKKRNNELLKRVAREFSGGNEEGEKFDNLFNDTKKMHDI